jgi:hypothetical protein
LNDLSEESIPIMLKLNIEKNKNYKVDKNLKVHTCSQKEGKKTLNGAEDRS